LDEAQHAHKKADEHLFIDVHHSFKVHSCCGKHDIVVITFNSFVKVTA
jgi:hypothetical protein